MISRPAGSVPASTARRTPPAAGVTPWWMPRRGRLIGWAAALFLSLTLLSLPATSQTFPKFSALVVDDANVIPADREAALNAKLEAFQKQTQRQLVIATIGDAQGYPLADYGYRLGRAWGVGLSGADNGVILLIAPNSPNGQRGPRIEVGRRLEPVLTDAVSSIIIRTKMMPPLRESNDIPGALEAGADAIIQQLSMPDDQAKAEATKAAVAFDREHKRSSSGGNVPFGLIFWGLVVLFVVLAMRRGRSGAKGPWGQQRYRSNDGNGWVWLWAAGEMLGHASRDHSSSSGGGLWGGGSGGGWSGGSDGGWGGGGFTGGGGGDFGGGGASGDW